MDAPASIEAILASLQPRETASHDFRPRAFRAWVAELPLANVAETGRLVHAALREMNRTRLPAPERLELLRSLEQPVADVLAAVRRHFVGRPLPLPERGRKAARVAMELAGQMALGYELAAREAARGGRTSLKSGAIHGALEHLGRVLLTAYQVYRPPPEGLWRGLHRLYGFAETHDLAGVPVAAGTPAGDDLTPTPAAAYKRALLLALACPYRMRQGEVQAVYRALAAWSGQARLEPLGDPIRQEGLFVVHLDSDEPPRYRSLDRVACTPATCRVLDTAPLGEHLRRALSGAREGDGGTLATDGRPTAALLRRLVLNWGVMPRRGFARAEHHAEAELLVGLSAIHQHLRREAAPPEAATPGAAWHGPEPVPGIEAVISGRARFEGAPSPGEIPDVWDLAYDAAPPTGSPRMVVPETEPAPSPPPELEYPVHRCQVENMSPGGYRIRCAPGDDGTFQLQVGELVGVRERGESRWQIAAVRWAKCLGPGRVEMGIQVIASCAEPGFARRDPQAPWAPVLLVPEVRSVQQPAGILAPPFVLRQASVVELRSADGTCPVRLTRTVENTGCFAHFHYARADRGENPQPGEDDIDALWSAL